MTPSENAPTLLGAACGALPSLIAAVVVAFVGADWTAAQTASVLALAAGLGAIVGALFGYRVVQKRYTAPREAMDLLSAEVADHGDEPLG